VWAVNTSIDFISGLCPLSCPLHLYKSTVENDSCSVSDIAFIVAHLCFKNHILATTSWKKKGGSVLCLCACGEGGPLVYLCACGEGGPLVYLCACGEGGPLAYSNLRISLQIFMKLHMNIISLILCFLQSAGVSPPSWRSWTNVWQHPGRNIQFCWCNIYALWKTWVVMHRCCSAFVMMVKRNWLFEVCIWNLYGHTRVQPCRLDETDCYSCKHV
jgi:hypothetical protein